MRTEMNLLETWTLPKDHPLKQAERERAQEWQVDFSREGELGFVAIKEWVVVDAVVPHNVALSDAA